MLLKGKTGLGSLNLIVGFPEGGCLFWRKFCFLRGFVWVKASTPTPDRGFERES